MEEKKELNQQVTTTIKNNDISEDGLEKKICYITQSFPQNFFINKLKNLARKNPENANVICDYIIVEQTEFNMFDIDSNRFETRTRLVV